MSEENHPSRSQNESPPNDASNLTPQSSEKIAQPASNQQSPPAKGNANKTSKWKTFWNHTKVGWLLFGEVLTLLWSLALWDSYRPKITVSPGGSLNSKSPFSTFFIVQNQGALAIANISYLTRLELVPAAGTVNMPHIINTEQNVTVIPQMGSLESYSLSIHYASVQIKTGTGTQPEMANQVTTNQVTGTAQFSIAALMLTFEVSYDPKWYFKRVQTFHFFGLPDVDGNWQWLPSANQNITDQIIDTNLIARGQPSPLPSPSTKILTNGGAQVHVN